ncbi:uncharacterized protein LOC130629828 [Hydractinia symbiolongicarpus]|uniref:uncharacterized protein LOC130629828 n=1 Tax=Hydractinia symbiolongicarpus TaxID=13093 RepID=UPI00255179E6|nr:uncharacterized protein LOC130629828 [Hydractinia symbiolongicarpus]
MMEDYLRHHPEVQAEQMVLGKIKGVIQQFGKRLTDFGLPALQEALLDDLPNTEEMRQEALNIRPLLNAEQLHVADSILNAVTNNNINVANIFFLDGPGGTGKTFTYNYIIKEVIARNLCVATCAWTGIAATLLQNGKVILLGGDFRQVLPVVRRAGPAQIVEVCLKSSVLWPLTRIFHLHTNMRAGDGEQVFAEFLLNLGSGQVPQKPDDPNQGCIEIPHECVLQPNENIVTSIFSEFDH